MENTRSIALEAIKFQNDSFGSDIESVIYTIKRAVDDDERMKGNLRFLDQQAKAISYLVSNRIGLKVNFIINTYCPGAMIVFPINKNHILLKDYWRNNYSLDDQDKLVKQFNNKQGKVDLAKAHVSGIFSEYEHTLYCDIIGNIERGLSVPEIVAIILHEIGHAFTYYEFSDRISSTNQVLADLAQTVKNKDQQHKRVYLFKELSSKLDIDEKEFEDLIEEDNRIIFGVKLFKKYSLVVSSLMNHVKYDETASEQLADNFASRFGYGRHLICALDKLSGWTADKSKAIYVFSLLLEIFDMYSFVTTIVFLILGGPLTFFASFVVVYSVLKLLNAGSNDRDMTYDDLKVRYKRIRDQLIEQVSQVDFDKEQLKNLINSIHEIDDVIKNTSVYTGIYKTLADFLFSSNGKAKEDIELQQLIETITHNELFVKAAEFKTM